MPTHNAIHTIRPYWLDGTWVFDDDRVGLDREPFVAGADDIITRLVRGVGLREPEKGFLLVFSKHAFPGHHLRVHRMRPESGGWWYETEDGQQGWLCPAMFHYFDEAPPTIFVAARQADPLPGRAPSDPGDGSQGPMPEAWMS